MERAIIDLLTRGVVALEKLGEEPELEIPASPPVCPNCGTFDPVITTGAMAGQGKLSQLFVEATCTHCSYSFLSLPQGWVNFTHPDELKEFLERAENGNSGRRIDCVNTTNIAGSRRIGRPFNGNRKIHWRSTLST